MQPGPEKDLQQIRALIKLSQIYKYLSDQGLEFNDQNSHSLFSIDALFYNEELSEYVAEIGLVAQSFQKVKKSNEEINIDTLGRSQSKMLESLIIAIGKALLNEELPLDSLKIKVQEIPQEGSSKILETLKGFVDHLSTLSFQDIIQTLQESEKALSQEVQTQIPESLVEDDQLPSAINLIFSQINFGGFSGKDFIKHQNKMIEELQIHKYNLNQPNKEKKEIFTQVKQIVLQNILRCTFEICDKLSQERIKLIGNNERDKYLESVTTYVETLKWICSEFRQKACEMLELNKHFRQEEIDEEIRLECFEKSNSLFTAADQQLLEVFRQDKEGLMKSVQIAQWVDRQAIISIAKYFKLSFMKAFENPDNEIDDQKMLEESVKVEDEVLLLFRVKRAILSKAIIEYSLEDEFEL